MEGQIVGKNYQLVKRLGAGAFGDIWKAVNLKNRAEFAVKMEDAASRHNQLYSECRIYLWLNSDPEVLKQAVPSVQYYGVEDRVNVMVLELLGPSLEDLFASCNRKFSLKTVLMVTDQMLRRIEYIHYRRLIHRDIKADNFVIGTGRNAYKIYVIDFGLAKKYMSSNGDHIKYKEGKGLTGTARYASVNTHIGIEQSRRDDLESLAYVLLYFLKGSLPWQNLKAKNVKEKYEKIKEKKIMTRVEDLCAGVPDEFAQLLNYCRKLKFIDKPDYGMLRTLFKKLMKEKGFIHDYCYDWVKTRSSSERIIAN